MLEKGKSLLVGFVKGSNYNDGKFSIKKIGDKGAGLSFSVSSKAKDSDKREYGKDIPVVVWMDNPKDDIAVLRKLIEGRVAIEGYFGANNYEKDGKTIRGHQFSVNFKDVYEYDDYMKKIGSNSSSGASSSSKNEQQEDEDDGWD